MARQVNQKVDGISQTKRNINWPPKPVVLITGGTGSFGQELTKYLLENNHASVVRVFSRDEFKQYEMKRKFNDQRLRFFIGDVRDVDRLKSATRGVDILVHAAAMKQVPACHYNPFEAVKTNIVGTENVITACIESGVKSAIFVSSDKAVDPVNLYGATKMVAERVWLAANQFSDTFFTVTRWGNVVGSRGSVIPLFEEQKKSGVLTITHKDMTRFWITLSQAVEFLWNDLTLGGVNFPNLRSARVVDIAKVIAPHARLEFIGMREGEKLHETLGEGYVSNDPKRLLSFKEVKKLYESL